MFRCSSLGWFAQFSKKFVKIADPLFLKMTPSPVFTQLKANKKKSLTADFHRSALKMVGLYIFGISDESTETTKSYLKFKDTLAAELSIYHSRITRMYLTIINNNGKSVTVVSYNKSPFINTRSIM